ncbi:MAG: PIN domain-containing protein [Desulfobacterales bacterium]|jgi:predicted nucleic acid-binding protein|nr:PIN domain-containing protein [Desulfobacterales bacterium]
MTDRIFIDTNILIYAHDLDAGVKKDIASQLLEDIWKNRNGILSTQVLQEFYVNITRKIANPLSSAGARSIIENYLVWHVQIITPESVLIASEIEERYQLSFWDAMILSSARIAGASKIATEDMNHGQKIEGILIENPFLV